MMRRTWIVLAALTLLAGACSSASENVAEQIIEGNDGVTNVDIDDDQITVEFDDEEGGGSMVIGGGEVPEGLPIPVPGGGEVVTSIEQPGVYVVVLTYPSDDYDDLVSFYTDWIADQDANNVANTSMSNPKAETWFGERTDGQFSIQIVETPDASGNAAVNVTLNWTATG